MNEGKKDAGLEESIYSLFCGQPVVCLSGSAEEAASAKESGKSLGQYLLEKENEKEKEEETDREDIEESEEILEEETEKKEEEEKKPSTECEDDAEHILSCQKSIYQFLLSFPEGIISKIFFQNLIFIHTKTLAFP